MRTDDQKLPAEDIKSCITFSQLDPEGAPDEKQDFCSRHSVDVRHSVDIGCGCGESTRWLANAFPAAQTCGVDISAHFLALAELRRRSAACSSLHERHGGASTKPFNSVVPTVGIAAFVPLSWHSCCELFESCEVSTDRQLQYEHAC